MMIVGVQLLRHEIGFGGFVCVWGVYGRLNRGMCDSPFSEKSHDTDKSYGVNNV